MIISSGSAAAFVHVDVDGLWALRRCYGRAEGDSFKRDPVWSDGVPLSLEVFSRHGIDGSYFIVGRDMMIGEKAALARAVADAGHELGNHSYSHRLGMTLMPIGRIADEILRTEKAMERAGLPKPRGFRAPGYDIDSRVLRTVRRLGYHYDASMLPTPWSPVMRLADAWMAGMWQGGKRQFGRITYSRAPSEPYYPDANRIRKRARGWSPGHDPFVEIPVGILPGWRLPLTASTIFALGAERVMTGLRALARRGQSTLLLLHAVDFVDWKRANVFGGPRRMGGFNLSVREKLRMIEPVLECLTEEFNVQRADLYCEELRPEIAAP